MAALSWDFVNICTPSKWIQLPALQLLTPSPVDGTPTGRLPYSQTPWVKAMPLDTCQFAMGLITLDSLKNIKSSSKHYSVKSVMLVNESLSINQYVYVVKSVYTIKLDGLCSLFILNQSLFPLILLITLLVKVHVYFTLLNQTVHVKESACLGGK